ncbi:MAG TPA: TonB-dependent receptor, partial [bacterium]|nr:TonB-dependent receptor [bacterium]
QEDPLPGVTLDKDAVETLPHVGDDLFRVVGCLPGVATNDVSSNFSIRGGLPRESLVLLDGIELFEPFHMKDLGGVISVVDAEIVENMNLIPGGFTAEYGDRSGGVLEIDTLDPEGLETSVGTSFSTAWFNTSGTFHDGDGFWLLSARRGWLDLVMKLAGAEEDGEKETIRYWDTFGKVGYRLNPYHQLTVSFLASDDSTDMEEHEPDEYLDLNSSYGNAYLWLKHSWILSNSLLTDTRIYAGQITNTRDITDEEHGDASQIYDDRETDIFGITQDWKYAWTDHHFLKFGWEYRRFSVDYDYLNEFDFGNAIPDDRFIPPVGGRDIDLSHTGNQLSGYLSDQVTVWKRLTGEIGVRFDRFSISEESVLSPRVNIVYDLGGNQAARLSWGQYYQSHKPNELDVQDGETEFYDSEKTQQFTAGYEALFSDDFRVRCDAYYRITSNPRPRYVNIFDPLPFSPEARPDRARLNPLDSEARGIELFMSSRHGRQFDWWLNYALSSVKDTIDGRKVYRNTDQTHAVKVALNYHPTERWDINLTWHYHTGWPKTRVTAEYAEDASGETVIVPVVGDFYTERFPAYHRLDMRVNYKVPFRRSLLTLFLDIQNVYNRENVSGFSFEGEPYREYPDGRVEFHPEEETWLGILPSFGVKYTF